MSAQEDVPRNGPARLLFDADPDIPLDELAQRLEELPRWQCADCGLEKFTRPESCSRCGGHEYRKVIPDGETP